MVKLNVNGIEVTCEASEVALVMASLGTPKKARPAFDTTTAYRVENENAVIFEKVMNAAKGKGSRELANLLCIDDINANWPGISALYSAFKNSVKDSHVYHLSKNAEKIWLAFLALADAPSENTAPIPASTVLVKAEASKPAPILIKKGSKLTA